jgi:hypothetical protein
LVHTQSKFIVLNLNNFRKEEAREREAVKKKEEKVKKERQIEDEYWQETDAKVVEKLNKDVCLKK